MHKNPIASERDLSKICRQHFPAHVATVAAHLLYWSQHAEHERGGRLWFYKQDSELVEEFGKSPSSFQRAIKRFCSTLHELQPNILFVATYGPKPWAQTGRVRWLSRTPFGDDAVAAALALSEQLRSRRRQRYVGVDTRESRLPQASGRRGRTGQNASAYMNQKHTSDSHSENLSSRLNDDEKRLHHKWSKESQEEVERFVRLWNTTCEERGMHCLRWYEREIRLRISELCQFVDEMSLHRLSDEELLSRLRLLSGDVTWLEDALGDAFVRYNANGFQMESLFRYGRRLWAAIETKISEPKARSRRSLREYGSS